MSAGGSAATQRHVYVYAVVDLRDSSVAAVQLTRQDARTWIAAKRLTGIGPGPYRVRRAKLTIY